MDEQQDCFDERREWICNFWISPLEDKIVQITKNDRAAIQNLGEIIAGEPLLAVRLLRLVKLIPGLPQVPATVAQAISILGVDQLKALTLGICSLSLAQVPSTEKDAEVENGARVLRRIWGHSLGCAMLAGRIARNVGNMPLPFVFVAGFLHDIGRLLLFRHSTEQYLESMTVAMEKNIPLTEAETLASGLNHQELGEVWSRRLELPGDLATVIRYHHRPPCMLPEFIADEIRKVISVVRLADLTCESQGVGSGGEREDGIQELWATCDQRKEELAGQCRVIKREVEAAREIFGFRSQNTTKTLSLPRPLPTGEAVSSSQRQKVPAHEQRGEVVRFPLRNDLPPEREGNPVAKRLTILVVEDHESLCEMLSLYLSRSGYRVRTADNGQVALDVLAREHIDLVLLDLMLPRMDGFALLKRVCETQEDTKPYIIVVSAGASEKDRNRILELGANEYMPKPFHLIRLSERIQAVEKYLLS